MLKLIFWSLLSINAALFAYGKGYLGNFQGDEREPGRMKNQLNADKLKLTSPAPAAAPAKPSTSPAPAPVAAPAAPVVVAAAPPAPPAAVPTPAPVVVTSPAPPALTCALIGNFAAPEARRFEALVAPLEMGPRQTRENVAVQEITSYIVFIPPQASKEAADRKADELKALGVSNYFVMNDSTPMKWAISLGVFKSEAAAQTLLAALNKQGVAGAKVAGRPSQVNRLAYRFRSLDPATKARLDTIAAGFPEQESRACN